MGVFKKMANGLMMFLIFVVAESMTIGVRSHGLWGQQRIRRQVGSGLSHPHSPFFSTLIRPAGGPPVRFNEVEEGEGVISPSIHSTEKMEKMKSPFTEFIRKLKTTKQPTSSFQPSSQKHKVHIGFITSRFMERPLPPQPSSDLKDASLSEDSTSNLLFLQNFSLNDLRVFSLDNQESRDITLGQYLDSTSVVWIPHDYFIPGFTPGRFYYLGFGYPDYAYQACQSPSASTGRCRFLQHCSKPEIVASIDTFISHACPIGNDFMGVCCPDLQFTSTLTPPTESSVIATQTTIISTTPQTTTVSSTTTASTTTTKPTITTQKPPTTALPSTTVAPLKRGCGEQLPHTNRIVGGQRADKREWPWIAALLRTGTEQYCGGVLITDQHVLTASHCVDSFKPENLTIRLGEYEFSSLNNGRRDFKVGAILMHEKYDRKTFSNDIAVVRLKEKVNFTEAIWPICMPPRNLTLEGQSAYVVGWGTTSYNGIASDVLMEVELPIWNLEECRAAFTQSITSNHLCAGYKEGGRDSCQGDSGGPLMYKTSSGRWVVIGVVSWGIRCAEKGRPGVYTRVTSYWEWVQMKVVS